MDNIAFIKLELQKKRSILLGETKKEINKQLNGEYRALVNIQEDGAGDITEDVSFGLLAKNRRMLRDIEAALAKISTGEYGICEECEESIPVKRLLAIPSATMCVPCQEEADKMSLYEEPEETEA